MSCERPSKREVAEFRVAGRKVYLSPVMDLFDRCIVAHTVSPSPSIEFIAKFIDKSDCERVKLFVCGAGFIGICRSGRGRPQPFG